MVDRDANRVVELGRVMASEAMMVARAASEHDQHGALAAVAHPLGPHVEIQAILALTARLIGPVDHLRVVGWVAARSLRRDVAKLARVANVGPRMHLLRWQEAILLRGR